jgi:hypothetical protein
LDVLTPKNKLTYTLSKEVSRVKYTILLTLVFSLFSESASAAKHYVKAGASGNGSGGDWTNAYTALPATLVRGDTYVVAGGSYGSHTFKDPASGTTLITIRKASSASAYRDDLVAGWNSSYETTQAVFGSLTFTSSYYWIDGVTPGTNWPTSNLGFKVSDSNYPIQMGAQVAPASNNTFRNIELATPGSSSDTEQFNIFELDNEASVNDTWSYCYFHGGENAVHSAGGGGISNWTFEYSYFDTNWSSSAHHGEQFAIWYGSSNHVIRYNYFNSYQGTGLIMAGGDGATETNIQIYGNVFYNLGLNNGAGGAANGAFGTMDSGGTTNLTNWKIYNNTFVNGNVRLSSPSGGSATGWLVKNNLFYNTSADTFNSNPSGTYDYNYHASGSWGWPTGTNDQVTSADPFVNAASMDFHLAGDTNPWTALPSPYSFDPDGVQRNSSRGAFQFSGPMPGTPTQLSAVAQ